MVEYECDGLCAEACALSDLVVDELSREKAEVISSLFLELSVSLMHGIVAQDGAWTAVFARKSCHN